MRDFWNALGLLLLAVVIIYVVTNWNTVKKYFNSASSTTSSDTTTASATSTDTTASVDTTISTGTNPPVTSYNIKVINQAGARVSHLYNMNGHPLFVLTNYYIPVNTLTSYSQVIQTSNYTYYRTNAGWVLANDVQAF